MPPSQAASSFTMEEFMQALAEHDYQFQKGQTVRGRVSELTSDGALVDIGAKAMAYLPIQEAALTSIHDQNALAQILPPQSEAEFVIVREQDNDGQVMISRRRLLIKEIWANLAEMQNTNQSLTVKVTGLNRGGVLVNVQGLRGFIPRSHLIEKEDLASLVGQTLTAGFLEIKPEANKLVLSQRMIAQATNIGQYEVGQLVEGEIKSIKPFGVFIQLDDQLAGLLHIKQISQKFISSLPDLFQIGQPLKAVIVNIDEAKARIALSTRVLEKHPGEMLEDMATVMAEASDRARKLKGKIGVEG